MQKKLRLVDPACISGIPEMASQYFPNLKELADDNSNDDKIVRFFSIREEIIVVKGEIAQLEQFLLLPQRFLKPSATTCEILLLFGKGLVNPLPK